MRHHGNMITRFARFASLLLLALGLVTPVFGEDPSASGPPLPNVHVAMETELGTITLALDPQNAPITTANFLRYVDEKRFDGTVFYRAMRLDWGTQPNGLIQGGTQGHPKRILPPIAHEPTNLTGITHKAGTISMARFAPGTATGDFSILLTDLSGLDAGPVANTPDNAAGFAAFGHITDGMDVVRKIFNAPLSSTKGKGYMKGQMIDKPVKILRMHRIPVTPGNPAQVED